MSGRRRRRGVRRSRGRCAYGIGCPVLVKPRDDDNGGPARGKVLYARLPAAHRTGGGVGGGERRARGGGEIAMEEDVIASRV